MTGTNPAELARPDRVRDPVPHSPWRNLLFLEVFPTLRAQFLLHTFLVPPRTFASPAVTAPICRTATPAIRDGTFFLGGAVNSNS